MRHTYTYIFLYICEALSEAEVYKLILRKRTPTYYIPTKDSLLFSLCKKSSIPYTYTHTHTSDVIQL